MDNENVSILKLTLYDRIFKPKTITLANGHSVMKRRSRAPLAADDELQHGGRYKQVQ